MTRHMDWPNMHSCAGFSEGPRGGGGGRGTLACFGTHLFILQKKVSGMSDSIT